MSPYNGKQRNATVYVVGLGTELERIFRRKEAPAAIAYSKETGGRLNHFNANTLCHGAMLAFFGE